MSADCEVFSPERELVRVIFLLDDHGVVGGVVKELIDAHRGEVLAAIYETVHKD